MFVILHIRQDVVREIASGTAHSRDAAALHVLLGELGLTLEPLHPGATDPELASQFFVTVPDERTAAEVSRRLGIQGAVEAAYLKPPDAAPSF
jgi:hypothetical protein